MEMSPTYPSGVMCPLGLGGAGPAPSVQHKTQGCSRWAAGQAGDLYLVSRADTYGTRVLMFYFQTV